VPLEHWGSNEPQVFSQDLFPVHPEDPFGLTVKNDHPVVFVNGDETSLVFSMAPAGWLRLGFGIFSSIAIYLSPDEKEVLFRLKLIFAAPQTGQTQLSGRSSNLVPGLMPLSGSPAAGSYTYPHI
jgi:hypothetical protein